MRILMLRDQFGSEHGNDIRLYEHGRSYDITAPLARHLMHTGAAIIPPKPHTDFSATS